jgi:hypothetical protein
MHEQQERRGWEHYYLPSIAPKLLSLVHGDRMTLCFLLAPKSGVTTSKKKKKPVSG